MQCNICHFSSAAFLPFGSKSDVFVRNDVIGAGYRLHAFCPLCGSLDRERLVFLYLRTQTRLFRTRARVLHVAPLSLERCIAVFLRSRPHLTYFNTDLSWPHVMVRMDISRMAFPDRTFDVIICNHVLEHVEDDLHAMRELFRVLKPGGWAVLQVPISYTIPRTYEDPRIRSAQDREQAFGQRDHVRIYGPDYTDRLHGAGFRVKVFDPAMVHGPGIVERHFLIKREVVFVGHRPSDE